MDYRGDVDAYGPADFRRLPELLIAKMGLGPDCVNGYVLRCPRTEEQLLLDAAGDPLFVGAITSSRSLATIVTTSAHASHSTALAELAETTHAVTAAHPAAAGALPVPPARVLADGDLLHVGEVPLTVLHLPGRTPGALALLHTPADGSAPHLFSGDALLHGGGPDEDHAEALRRSVFDVLPDETWVYPAHGPDTTVGQERARRLATAP